MPSVSLAEDVLVPLSRPQGSARPLPREILPPLHPLPLSLPPRISLRPTIHRLDSQTGRQALYRQQPARPSHVSKFSGWPGVLEPHCLPCRQGLEGRLSGLGPLGRGLLEKHLESKLEAASLQIWRHGVNHSAKLPDPKLTSTFIRKVRFWFQCFLKELKLLIASLKQLMS